MFICWLSINMAFFHSLPCSFKSVSVCTTCDCIQEISGMAEGMEWVLAVCSHHSQGHDWGSGKQ